MTVMAAVMILLEYLAEPKSVEHKVEGEEKQEKYSSEVLYGCRPVIKMKRKKQTYMKENETFLHSQT